LFGFEPTNPGTLAAVVVTIALGAAEWRASRLDPNDVLRVG
jgi:hypothetical protein